MPIEINGEKKEPWLGNMKGVKRMVKFKIASEPLKAQTENGVIEKPLASWSTSAVYTMRNAAGGYDVVRYYEHKTPKVNTLTGATSHQFTPEFMMIENGELFVNTKSQPDLYWWLNNHPDNSANPLYDVEENGKEAGYALEGRRTPFAFTEMDKTTKKKKEEELSFDEAVAKCIITISDKKQISDKQVATLYRAYGHGDADELCELEEFSTMRKSLVEHAKVDPALFMQKMESNATTLEARVNDCVNKGIIIYEQDGTFNGWMWGTTNKEFKGKAKFICPIEEHQYEERTQLLIDYLRTEAKGISIADEMKKEISVFGLGQA